CPPGDPPARPAARSPAGRSAGPPVATFPVPSSCERGHIRRMSRSPRRIGPMHRAPCMKRHAPSGRAPRRRAVRSARATGHGCDERTLTMAGIRTAAGGPGGRRPPKAVDGTARALDERFGTTGFARRALRKAFPDQWSFLVGEIAMYSFVVLLLTGVFLTLFFKPSMQEVVYDGSYTQLQGVEMSEAYASTLKISSDVRGGLLVRQTHHWATLIFMAAILVHLLRNFFSGAFRKPRELNWLIGVLMFTLVMLNGLFGYSLPDDLLSGTGLRILEGVLAS